MIAILKHELRLYFHSLTAYVFGAFLLLVVGIGAMYYNLMAAVSNFEYVLSFSSLIFAVIVPILTMRVIAEERKQKTDQLLYSLPISTTRIVVGKYLALLVLFLIPLVIICVYPLIFSQYGDVYLLTSYPPCPPGVPGVRRAVLRKGEIYAKNEQKAETGNVPVPFGIGSYSPK